MAKQTWLLVFCSLVILALTGCWPALDTGGDPTPSFVATEAIHETDESLQGSVTVTPAGDFDCAGVGEIPVAECQVLVAFYEMTNGPEWNQDALPWEEDDTGWLESDAPCSWVGITCVNGHVDMLYLGNSSLQGRLPVAWRGLTMLRVLDLHNNQIRGEIPVSLGNLSALESLDLSANQLTGSIPASLGQLTKLNRIDLYHNNLSGVIPPELGKLAALHTLDLAFNHLDGELPVALASLEGLQTLRLNDNQLEGTIPAGLGELSPLTEVNLAFNQLAGPVPAGLTPGITRALWGNRLDGTVEVHAGELVRARGVQFIGDPTVATAVWSEEIPASTAEAWWATVPAHLRLTLIRGDQSLGHAPMGIQVPGEAQVHVYDISDQLYDAAELDQSVQEQVAALQTLLEGGQGVNDDEPLPLLPLTNAAQMFHAQVARIDFAGGSGIRYLTQYAQGPSPVANDNLFYTFQGLADDGNKYVAAFFPVSASILPATVAEAMALPEMAAFLAGTESGYLQQTTQALNELSLVNFDPALDRIDDLLRSLSVATAGAPVTVQGRWPDEGEAVDAEPVLQWEAFPDASQYELVVVDDDAYPPFVAFSHTGPEVVVPIAPALAPGSYSWTVRAQDTEGNTLGELNRQFLVKAPVELLYPPAAEAVDAAPILQWQPLEGATQYQVTILDDGTYPPEVVFESRGTETAVQVDPPLPEGRHYTWSVWAQDAGGRTVAELNSDFNVYVTLESVQPADLSAVGPAPTLEWEPFAEAETYEVTVVTGYPPAVVFTTATTATRVIVSPPLVATDVHYWSVWAKDGDGQILAALSSSFTVER